MNNSSEERLKIAVFIDVDNISIGVKQSMNRNFDVGTVLEAIKEKGEIITKIAYGDWKRADDFSRSMTQHAIQMVQRNATPGGDKNGADIALALDALETAFTRPHINAFVIVGGDSDFIALVEKLKQYDKTVFVVGGRGFTSVILQKNCHEFISYENLVGVHTSRKLTSRIQLSGSSTLENALPLVRRALQILSDREVSPQLGLLKSTLLQLDSTFSERDYGVGSFRDFIQKLAAAGYIHLKQVDRSLLVELKNGFKDAPETEDVEEVEEEKETAETSSAISSTSATVSAEAPAEDTSASATSTPAASNEGESQSPRTVDATAPETTPQATDASKALEELFRTPGVKPHWPMYLRTFKQLLRAQPTPFDERQYGLSSTYDLARQAQRDGLLHIERNRQGILRIFPGDRFPKLEQETSEGVSESTETSLTETASVSTPETVFQGTIPETEQGSPSSFDSTPVVASETGQPGHGETSFRIVEETDSVSASGSGEDAQPEGVAAEEPAASSSSATSSTSSLDAAGKDAAGEKPKAKRPRTTQRKTTPAAAKAKSPRSTAPRKPRTPKTPA
ncbi:MAG: NYN domain-containing protein [Acidobacteriota bacterium]|jgi:uncharacterized LabA/DUF88 family protein/chemotaxis protein histidine kinase CheA|nr:NYN domain-containing protein [Acidobacteriota bacterium]